MTPEKRARTNATMRAWKSGMTRIEMERFFDEHGRRCAICFRPEDWALRGGGLVIDHDHRCCGSQDPQTPVADRPRRLCGKCNRGLLCVACNAGIGQFREDPARFLRAIAYLAERGVTPSQIEEIA